MLYSTEVSCDQQYAPAAFAMDKWRSAFERYIARFEVLAGPQQEPPHTQPAVIEEAEEARKRKGN